MIIQKKNMLNKKRAEKAHLTTSALVKNNNKSSSSDSAKRTIRLRVRILEMSIIRVLRKKVLTSFIRRRGISKLMLKIQSSDG